MDTCACPNEMNTPALHLHSNQIRIRNRVGNDEGKEKTHTGQFRGANESGLHPELILCRGTEAFFPNREDEENRSERSGMRA